MKKIILLFGFLTLISCSNSDEQQSNTFVDTSSILLKKSVSSSGNFNSEYIYDGKKLVKINTNSGIYITHTYSGDLITKVTQYNDNNEIITGGVYEYDADNRMINIISFDSANSIIGKTIYDYNLDGTVSYKMYIGAAANPNTLSRTGKIWLDSDGEILKNEQYQNNVLILKKENTFDNKNSSFKNITGFNKLLLSDTGKKRNMINSKTYDSYNLLTNAWSNKIIYDSNNFPKTIETTSITGSVSTVQYYYE